MKVKIEHQFMNDEINSVSFNCDLLNVNSMLPYSFLSDENVEEAKNESLSDSSTTGLKMFKVKDSGIATFCFNFCSMRNDNE